MPSRRKSHASAGKALRKLGVLPQSYNLRDLTKNQKDRIRKLERRYSTQLKHPTEFVSKHISGSTATKLRQAGYTVKRTGKTWRTILPRQGAESVRLDKGKIIHVTSARETITNVFARKDLFKQAHEFFKHKKKGQYLFLRVGDKTPFGVQIFTEEDFIKYLQEFEEAKPEAFNQIINNLYIVKVKPSKRTPSRDDYEA